MAPQTAGSRKRLLSYHSGRPASPGRGPRGADATPAGRERTQLVRVNSHGVTGGSAAASSPVIQGSVKRGADRLAEDRWKAGWDL